MLQKLKMTLRNQYKKLKSVTDEDETESFIGKEKNPSQEKFQMERSIDVVTGVSIVAGSIIGSGIFIIPSNILNYCQGF